MSAPYTGRCACGSVTATISGEPHGLVPQVAFWIDDAPAWAVIDPALGRFPGQPPPPPAS